MTNDQLKTGDDLRLESVVKRPISEKYRADWLPFLIAGVATVLVLMVAYFVYRGLAELPVAPAGFDALEKLGSYTSGIFSLIGVIWICATFYMQMRELSLQRQEYQMQRTASQSAAISFRAQMVISLHERAVAGLSDQVRSLLGLLVGSGDPEFQNAEHAHDAGDDYAFINLALRSSGFRRKFQEAIAGQSMPIVYLAKGFCKETEKLRRLLQAGDIPPEVNEYLFNNDPISTLYSEINSFLNIRDS